MRMILKHARLAGQRSLSWFSLVVAAIISIRRSHGDKNKEGMYLKLPDMAVIRGMRSLLGKAHVMVRTSKDTFHGNSMLWNGNFGFMDYN